MLNFTGVCEHLSVLANVRWTSALMFADDAGGAEVSLDGYTFEGEVATAEGSVALDFDREGAGAGEIKLIVPPLGRGRWDYEVRMKAETGDVVRLIYGKIAAVGEADEQTWGGREGRTMCVHLPKAASEHVMLEWMATSAAQGAADKAQQAAGSAVQAAEEVKQKVNTAVVEITEKVTEAYEKQVGDLTALKQAAEAAVADADASRATAEKALEKVETLEGRLEEFKDHLREQIVIDPETGEWVVAGVETGVKAQGDHGVSPTISTGYTWLVWDDEAHGWVDTGVSVLGKDGKAPYIDSEGYWMQWDVLTGSYVRTGVRAQGRDGLDGSATRRIIIDSAAELPEAVQRGVFYYAHRWQRQQASGTMTAENEWDAALAPASGVPSVFRWIEFAVLNDNSDVPCYMVVRATIGSESRVVGVSAAPVTWANGQNARWEFAAPVRVPEGATQVGFYLTLSAEDESAPGVRIKTAYGAGGWSIRYETLMSSGLLLLPAYGAEADGYDVYAPLEYPDGSGEWVLVGEQADVATRESLGMSRLGTSAVLAETDAAVGHDAQARLRVPAADGVSAGAVKLGVTEAVENGSDLGRDAAGNAVVVSATANRYGGVKCSMGEQAGCKCLGLTDEGTLGARWATLYKGGAVRLGSVFGQLNRVPYQQGVGATSDHQISNNLLYSGALQHQKKAAWSAKQMAWLDAVSDTAYFNSNDYYTGLCTTNQFTQSESIGLSLNSATTDMLAGVYLSVDMNDARENAVPTGPMVVQWSLDTHWTKAETMNNEQLETRITERICETHESIWQNLDACERTETLLARDYATNTRVNEVYDGCIKVAHGIDKWRVMTAAAFGNLQTRDKNTLYIVTNE